MRLSTPLLRWYDRNRRDLPWRGRTDAYEVWVSEVMLQQTRVETVVNYYQSFLDRFPTVEHLAGAEVEDVLAAWSGLGYYRRARHLHAAACLLTRAGRGVPTTVEKLRALPGIGDYTAAAVASIAFGRRVPVLDGNVERVLTRLLAMEENPRAAEPRRRLVEYASGQIDRSRPGDFNQALMELGATICVPRKPDCARCPLRPLCRGHELGRAASLPVLPRRREPKRERRRIAVVRRGDRILMTRRPETVELLAGVWELPWVMEGDGESPSGAEEALAERYGGSWRLERARARVRHALTFRALDVSVCRGRWKEPHTAAAGRAGESEIGEGIHLQWVSRSELERLPTTSLVGKALAAIEN